MYDSIVKNISYSGDDEQVLSILYERITGIFPEAVVRMPGAGSNRRYYRLSGVFDVVGVSSEDLSENNTFIYLAKDFYAKGLPVPKVLASSDSGAHYLVEDLGDVSLFDYIYRGRERGEWNDEIIDMLKKTIAALTDFQWCGIAGLDINRLPVPQMDYVSVTWDLNYFKYCFLLPSGVKYNETLLEKQFDRLATALLEVKSDVFMYRDFQSRNVMIKDGTPWFIDFQGGRRGPCYYDVASFLWQAKASYPDRLREELITAYLDSAKRYADIDRAEFRRHLDDFVLFRLLQVLGAYGYRGNFERKSHFVQSIPYALENIKGLVPRIESRYGYLCQLLLDVADTPRYRKVEPADRLTVKVASFGYKRHGIPSDISGNGGGFVFDCRALHNPGRYDEYKNLSGRDSEVIEFLETKSDIIAFVDEACRMVDRSVSVYRERGFTDLMVSFGCTGGQHRSVYCADRLARYIRKAYPDVRVELTHFERGIKETFNPRLPHRQ